MSDNWFRIIPEDPLFRPDRSAIARLDLALRSVAPKAEDFSVDHDADTVRFFDCGGNFTRALCPNCDAEIATEDWHRLMDADFDTDTGGFALNRHETPCCGASATVNDLSYDWPQGFAKFGFSAMNPDRGPLTEPELDGLARALGAPVRIIYVHI